MTHKRFIAWTLAVLTAVQLTAGTCTAAHAAVEPPFAGLEAYPNNEVLVLYQDGNCETLTFPSRESLNAGLLALRARGDVALVQPNHTYRSTALTVNDVLSKEQWALSNDGSFTLGNRKSDMTEFQLELQTNPPADLTAEPRAALNPRSSGGGAEKAQSGIDVNAQAAWGLYGGGKREVVIALIDTGVDTGHEDLGGILWTNSDEIAGNGLDDDENGYIDDVNGWNFYHNNSTLYTGSEDSHGTHCAGIMAANPDNGVGIAGIIPGTLVKIMVLKAIGGAEGTGSTESVIQAIRYAEDNGASVCNMSLATDRDDMALHQTIASSGMLFVAAAGNDGVNSDVKPSYPASYALDNVLSVANLSCGGALHGSSNYGKNTVDLAAPGAYILSTTPGNGYRFMTGTSMAAPMVTAAAAMVYARFDTITLADVKALLLASVRPLDALTGKVASGGMLDLGAALGYDISTLSGEEWGAGEPGNRTGSAPVLQFQTSSQNGVLYLLVGIMDLDGDLEATSCATGTITAESFRLGRVGDPFQLGGGGISAFQVRRGGTYSFYARDKAGNETVKTVIMSNVGGQVTAVVQ